MKKIPKWIQKMRKSPPLIIVQGGTQQRPRDTSLDKYRKEIRHET